MITLVIMVLLFGGIIAACLSVSVALLWQVVKGLALIAAIVVLVRIIKGKNIEQ